MVVAAIVRGDPLAIIVWLVVVEVWMVYIERIEAFGCPCTKVHDFHGS